MRRAASTSLLLLLGVGSLLGVGCKSSRSKGPIVGWAPPPSVLLPVDAPPPAPSYAPPPVEPAPPAVPAPYVPAGSSELRPVLEGACRVRGVSSLDGATYVHVSGASGEIRALRFVDGMFDPSASAFGTQVAGSFPGRTHFLYVGPAAAERYVGRLDGGAVKMLSTFGTCKASATSTIGWACDGARPAHLEAFPWLEGSTLVLGHFGERYATVLGGKAAPPDMKLAAPVVRGEFHSGASLTATAKGLAVYAELVTWQVPRLSPDAPPDIRVQHVWIETSSPQKGVVSTKKKSPEKLLATPRTAPGPDGSVLVFVPGSKEVLRFAGDALTSFAKLPFSAHEVVETALMPSGEVYLLVEAGGGVPTAPGGGARSLVRMSSKGALTTVPVPDELRTSRGTDRRLAVARGVLWLRGDKRLYRAEGDSFTEVTVAPIAGANDAALRWFGSSGEELWVAVGSESTAEALLTTAPMRGAASCSDLDRLTGLRWVR